MPQLAKPLPVIPSPIPFIKSMQATAGFIIARHKYILDTAWYFCIPITIPPTMEREKYEVPTERTDLSGVLLSSIIDHVTYEMEDLAGDMVRLEERLKKFPEVTRKGFRSQHKVVEELYDEMRDSWETVENALPVDLGLGSSGRPPSPWLGDSAYGSETS